MKISVKKDLSPTPGGRWRRLGPNSGEEFYDSVLSKKFEEAVNNDEMLILDLDGVIGYPSSFIDQSFGTLSRRYGSKKVLKYLRFISEDQPSLVDIIIKNIKDPDNYEKNN